jgi:hypothetical protein
MYLSCSRSLTNTLQFDTTRSDGQFRKPASNKRLLELMGGFEFTPFQEGGPHISMQYNARRG